MKKEIEVTTPARKARKSKKMVAYCDFCEKEARYICSSCSRDLCRYTLDQKVSHSHYDPDDSGDYPDRYCPICYEFKYKKFRGDYMSIIEEQDRKEEALNEAVKTLSLETDPRDFLFRKDELSN
jgi:hypothetical protein